MLAHDLLRTAEALIESSKGKPKQAYLRRAVSTIYYALFHCLARCCADTLVGTSKASVSAEAWRQAYRALEHGYCKGQCKNHKVLSSFPQQIQDFANLFVSMQEKRHAADYDPMEKLFKSSALTDLATAQTAISDFQSCLVKDRRAFAVWVMLKERKN